MSARTAVIPVGASVEREASGTVTPSKDNAHCAGQPVTVSLLLWYRNGTEPMRFLRLVMPQGIPGRTRGDGKPVKRVCWQYTGRRFAAGLADYERMVSECVTNVPLTAEQRTEAAIDALGGGAV